MTIPFDTTKPNMARMYDYWLGGKDNFEADRKAAEAVRVLRPNIAEQAFDNKKFLTRAVSYVAAQGVRQFLDVGSGLPTSPVVANGAAPLWRATHEAAQAVIPDALVAYVDVDPVAVRHSQALLADGSSRVVAVDGDMRDPQAARGPRGPNQHDRGRRRAPAVTGRSTRVRAPRDGGGLEGRGRHGCPFGRKWLFMSWGAGRP